MVYINPQVVSQEVARHHKQLFPAQSGHTLGFHDTVFKPIFNSMDVMHYSYISDAELFLNTFPGETKQEKLINFIELYELPAG